MTDQRDQPGNGEGVKPSNTTPKNGPTVGGSTGPDCATPRRSRAIRGGALAPEGTGSAVRDVERRRLRSFGLTVGAAFCILAALLLWKDRGSWPIFAALGGLSLLMAGLAPMALRPIERVWMRVARAMGWVMTRVILGIIFLVIFTPAGLIMKLLRKDPME
ncbi:MAG: hypothetical protein KAY24_17915, partial [Candidatus Eisenbacteria sp.]|nr:hypothetical protein [Candidatus Eisenbacteria bacterium]